MAFDNVSNRAYIICDPWMQCLRRHGVPSGKFLLNLHSREAAMGIFRLYTGDDGQSHLEELDLASHPNLTAPAATSSILFRESPPGRFLDWHNAPRRQYVINIAGEVEIGLGDDTVHRFGPGHVTLAEDLTGQGHTTRAVGTEPRISATIPISD
jgi:hypothetical protein